MPSEANKLNSNGLYSATTRYHRSQSQDTNYRALYPNTNGYASMPPTSTTGSSPSANLRNGGPPPLPPPLMQKSSPSYKPVPPPKPKNYPPRMTGGHHHNQNGHAQNGLGAQQQQHMQSTSFVESNYMNAGNGKTGAGDDDSGQGSSLDRDYGLYNNTAGVTSEPRYANPPEPQYYSYQQNGTINGNYGHAGGDSSSSASPPRRLSADQKSLDLTNNREYRGSAFEVYKKPPQQQYHHHNSVW